MFINIDDRCVKEIPIKNNLFLGLRLINQDLQLIASLDLAS